MDSELTDLAGVKGVTISTLQVKPSEGAFANGDKTKLDGIEASADVTDTANVTSAGAVMDSELTSIADVKALDQSVISGASPTFTTTNMTDASNKRFMSDAQETKLDSVESSATADQTAAEILTAVKTVDGASSGLDADLLDGVEGASYLRSDADDTYTGNLTVAGRIGLGDADTVADHELHIQSSSPTIRLEDTDGNQRFDITQNGGTTNVDYESGIIFKKADATEIVRFDGAGLDVTGEVTITSHLDMPDDAKIKLGTGDDLEIYHDGSNSYISDTGTGDIIIKGQYVRLQDEVGTNLLTADGNDAVSLYFGGAAKLATTTSGIDVTGTLQVEGATGETIRLHRDDTTITGGNLIGQIAFSHNDDTNSGDGVLIKGVANGGTGNTTLQIHTGTPGSLTEKIRISDSGVDVTGTVEFDGLSGTGAVTVTDILDEDDMSTNSATMLATQQSIKAYVDANAGSMSNAQVRTAVEAATDSNVFTDADHTKLNGIEASATADQTAAEILTAIKTVDGSGSGLDADTVDGIGSGSFLRSDTDDAVNAYTTQITFPSNTTGATASGDQSSLQVKQTTANADAFMTFHVDTDFAVYFGLDGTTNDLFVGGWSMGANKYKIWHQNNDGSGSGLDADTLDGVQGASYLRSDADDTFTGTLTMAGQLQMNGNIINDVEDIYLRDKIYHDNDTNNYFHFETDKQNFVTGGAVRMVIEDSGVTIGASTTSLGTTSGDILTGLNVLYDTANADNLLIQNKRISAGTNWETAQHRIQRKVDATLMGYISFGKNGDTDPLVTIGEGASTDYVTVTGGGDVDLSADLTVGADLYLTDTNTKITEGSGNVVRIQSNSGYVDVGPQNTSYSHFSTDRASFYFNKRIVVDEGIIASYDEDMQLLPGASTQSAYIKLVNGGSTTNGTYHYFVDDNADQSTNAHTMSSNQSGSQTTTSDRYHTNLFVDTNVTATGGGTDHEHRPIGIYNDMDITGSNTDPDLIWGVYNYITCSQTGTGQTGSAYADYNQTYLNHESSSQLIQSSYGTFSRVYHANAAGTTTNSYAAYNHNYYHSSANADTSASYGTYSEVEANRNITYPNFIANLAVIDRNDGTISNGYMYKADYQGTLPTNAWGMYVEGDKHYLQGRVGINTTSPSSSYALDVNGDIVCDKIRIEGTGDASLSSTTHGLQVGATGGGNIAIDGNEILARDNGASSSLILQNDGGNISACAGGGSVTFGGSLVIPSQIIHSGDTNTYMQFHAADQFRVVTGGTERLEVNNSQVTVQGVLGVNGAIDLADNITLRFGTGDDVEFFFSGADMYTDLNAGSWFIRDGTTTKFLLQDGGNFHADANIFAYSTSVGSDRKLKDNIEVIESPLEKIQKLNGVTFNWKRDGEASAGVIAQDVQKVLPSAVKEVPELNGEGEDATRLNVDYNQIIGLLVESVKELKKEIEELKKGK